MSFILSSYRIIDTAHIALHKNNMCLFIQHPAFKIKRRQQNSRD